MQTLRGPPRLTSQRRENGCWFQAQLTLHGQQNIVGETGPPRLIGKFRFPLLGNAQYIGELLQGKRHGFGKQICHSGTYVGDFRHGVMHGLGKREYCDGVAYEGEWKRGFKHGSGKVLFPTGATFEGNFSEGKMHGVGVLRFANGDKYEGSFENGAMQGDGTYHFHSSRGKYEGTFQANELHGYGSLRYKNDQEDFVYLGQFDSGMMHGQGELQLECGDAFEGEFREGRICGYGFYHAASGARYEGDFSDGVPDGHGTFDTGPGQHRGSFREPLLPPFTHTGNWKHGRPHGVGTLRIHNERGAVEVVEGKWSDGWREGPFRHTYPWGQVVEETFREGERIAWSAIHDHDDERDQS